MGVKLSAVNIFAVGLVTPAEVMHKLDTFIGLNGERTEDISAVFCAGMICSDYAGDVEMMDTGATADKLIFTEKDPENYEKYYERLTSAVFVDITGHPVPPCSTIRLFDEMNGRRLVVAVAYPGLNLVYYETARPTSAAYAISLLSDIEGSRFANHMEPQWERGNSHDLITVCQLFGFPYDKVTDEVIIPSGKPQSSFVLARNAGAATLSAVRGMMGGK